MVIDVFRGKQDILTDLDEGRKESRVMPRN